MKKVIRRALVVGPIALVQLLWFLLLCKWLTPYAAPISLFLSVLAAFLVLYILTSRKENAYKSLWLMVMLVFPVAGAILYLAEGDRRAATPIRRKLEKAQANLPPKPETAPEMFRETDPRMAQTFRYVEKKTGFPTYPCPETRYYPLGENMYPDMLEAMERAEKFIYVEYFIIEDGKMWDPMVEILERKSAQGVDVRVIYDDVGSIATYSLKNLISLRQRGIPCMCFNPMLSIKGTVNYRDHRKMLIVDGRVAFSGGVNLADEYINEKVRFGHWKDIGYRLTGPSAASFTRMFAEFWNAFSDQTPVPEENLTPVPGERGEGLLLPYFDSPLYGDAVSNNLYVELLSQATEYAWFYTPYLMPGEQLMDAMILAAQRGVDVRILMPGIPDKKLVFRMSRSYYRPLLAAGIRIFEYTPGFLHAKGCVVDGRLGTLGTVNLDYRSLFLHFENNTLFYNAPVLRELAKDFLETQEKSAEIRPDSRYRLGTRILDGILRICAPLC